MYTIKPGIRGDLRHKVIGPRHDPYDATTVKIDSGSNGSATLYVDGLGTCKATFWSDFDNINPARVIKWDGNDRRLDRQMTLKANIIARRTMGIRFDDVVEHIHRMPTDPMGPASRYM